MVRQGTNERMECEWIAKYKKCGAEIKSSANIDNNNLACVWNGLLWLYARAPQPLLDALYHKIIIYDANVLRKCNRINHSGGKTRNLYVTCQILFIMQFSCCICTLPFWVHSILSMHDLHVCVCDVRPKVLPIESTEFLAGNASHKTK